MCKGNSAPALLHRAADIMEERSKQYDKPGGERSMASAVAALNAVLGREAINEAEGWLFMQILKDVRQFQHQGSVHQDSLEDCIAYSALKAECVLKGK